MNKLELKGIYREEGIEPLIEYKTESRSHYLPLVFADNVSINFKDGEFIEFVGELRTINKSKSRSGRKEHFAYGTGKVIEGGFSNRLSTIGVVVSRSELRTTPLTRRKIVDFVLANGDNYFNCIIFGKKAVEFLETKDIGSKLYVEEALFQSRDYEKDGNVYRAYEVCVRKFI